MKKKIEQTKTKYSLHNLITRLSTHNLVLSFLICLPLLGMVCLWTYFGVIFSFQQMLICSDIKVVAMFILFICSLIIDAFCIVGYVLGIKYFAMEEYIPWYKTENQESQEIFKIWYDNL